MSFTRSLSLPLSRSLSVEGEFRMRMWKWADCACTCACRCVLRTLLYNQRRILSAGIEAKKRHAETIE